MAMLLIVSVVDYSQADITVFQSPFIWHRECKPLSAPSEKIRMYMRIKGGCDTVMALDDQGYESQVAGANTLLTQGCNISGDGSDGDVATEISTPLEFGRGTWFNLNGGGTFTGGFQTPNIDERGRIIYIVADQNTILVNATNLDLGGCNLNMSAGRPHQFWTDGCKWHLVGHHNDF